MGRTRAIVVLAMLAVLGPLSAPPAVARGRVHRRTRLRLAMRMAPLPPAWTHSTEALESAPDAPDESRRVVGPGGIAAHRLRQGASRAACLRELRRLKIPYRAAKPRRGVGLPVEITGPLHGVTFKALYSSKPPLVDCAFALGLEKGARVLARFGVTTALYTSTWRPPPRRRWRRIGHHPQGMAMDINELKLKDGTHLVVLKDWEKLYGVPGNCVGRPRTSKGALLRRMVCALEKAHIFRRILTPDSDRPHKNHWHISGAEIGEAFTRGRWCGRTLQQPLPGRRGFRRYYYWYRCWKIRNPRRRYRCYRHRARRKPRAPVPYRLPKQTPRVAIWLKSQIKATEVAPESNARAVTLPPDERPHGGKTAVTVSRAGVMVALGLVSLGPGGEAASAPVAPRSVEVYKGRIRVYTRPLIGSPWRGFITRSGRFPILSTRPKGGRCPMRWVQIGPESWVCSGWLLPRKRPPSARSAVQHVWRPGALVGRRTGRWRRLNYYPNLRALSRGRPRRLRGDLGFDVYARLILMRRVYLVTRTGGLVAADEVKPLHPTSLVGLSLRRPRQLPLVIALRDTPLLRRRGRVLVPSGRSLRRYGARRVKRSRRQPALSVVGAIRYVVLTGGLLVRRDQVALASRPPAPPPGVGPKTRWVDVDARERLVYAMRGARPVRVMLTSLGPNTPRGVFRVEQKIVAKHMQRRGGADPFFLESVPHVVFFKGDFALHGAYWHDRFGSRPSHGCPNLSPADARFVFDWLTPVLPPGYVAIYATKRDRGGVVRIRNRYVLRPGEPRPK